MSEAKTNTEQLGLSQLGEALRLCFKLFRWLFFICLIGFLLSGIHTVPQGKIAFIQRFGEWMAEAETPGIHFALPPFIDKVVIFDLQEQRSLELTQFDAPDAGKNTMSDRALLTGDGQIVHTKWALTYRIKEPQDVWNLLGADYDKTLNPFLEKILASLVISQCSDLNIDGLLVQHQKLQNHVTDNLQAALQNLNTGLEIIDLNLIGPRVPPSTVDAFENVQRQLLYNENIRGQAELYAEQLYQKIDVTRSQNIGQAKAKAQSIVQQLKGEALAINTLINKYDKETRQAYLEQRLQTALLNAMEKNVEQTFILQPGGERRIQLSSDPQLRRTLIKKMKKEAEAKP
jgi:membrane protease subunit HflK